MSIVIDTPTVHKSIATVLHSIDATATIYDNPNQQGTKLPAWFIVHREPVSITEEINQRHWLVYHIDIYYMLEYNRPRLFDEYATIADQLDLSIEYLPIYEGNGALVHVFERSWELAMNALKYSITLRFRVRRDTVQAPYMQVIEDLEVFLKGQNQAVLSFENTTHPEFDAQIPSPISVTKGQSVSLPFVGGEFEDDDYKWTPSGWSVGAFGARIRLDENITTNLLWSSTEKTATLSFTNTTHPEFSVQMPESITANKGTSVELPTVSGTFPVGSVDWTPSAWSVGSFGDSFILDEDTTTDLQWSSTEVEFTLSFSNSNHPEFDVDLPQTELITRGDSVTLPSVSGSFIVDGYEWTPDSWDIGAFGASYTPNSDVIANLLWRSVSVWPTVSLHGDFGSDNWLYADSSQSSSVSVASNSQIGLLLDRSYQTYDDSKSYAVQQWYVNSSTVGTTGDFVIAKQVTQIAAKNVSSSTKYILKARVAICSSNQATVITVYNSNNNPFNAFKFTLNGTDYYYVLDDVQTDWTDDLASIGYSLTPIVSLPTVSVRDNFGQYNWVNTTTASAAHVVLQPNGGTNALYYSGNTIPYDNTKSYGVILRQSTDYQTDDGSMLSIVNVGQNIYVKNESANEVYVQAVRIAVCSSNQTTRVNVYNSSNEAFNAFKFVLDGTEYYYVLDGTQTDWTDDLESIGFSLNPLFEEFTLYCERSVLNYMRNITSSSVITGASTTYRRQLFLDSSRTTPFTFNTSKRYVKGRYISGVWTPDPVQSIADMPSTTTGDIGVSEKALIIVGVNGTTIGVNGNAWILAITNYTGYDATTPASPCYIRVYNS